MHDSLKLRKDVGVGFWRVRVVTNGDFDDGQANRPDVGRHGVKRVGALRFPLYPLRRHVGLTPDVGFGQTLFQLRRHAKIAQLDLALLIDQDVGWLDV